MDFILNRPDYEVTANSRICADHFDAQYIKVNVCRTRLVPFSQNPVPTIHPLSTPQSQAVVPTLQRKQPKVCVFQPDEVVPYMEKYNHLPKVFVQTQISTHLSSHLSAYH